MGRAPFGTSFRREPLVAGPSCRSVSCRLWPVSGSTRDVRCARPALRVASPLGVAELPPSDLQGSVARSAPASMRLSPSRRLGHGCEARSACLERQRALASERHHVARGAEDSSDLFRHATRGWKPSKHSRGAVETHDSGQRANDQQSSKSMRKLLAQRCQGGFRVALERCSSAAGVHRRQDISRAMC